MTVATTAPMPRLADLLALWRVSRQDDSALAAPWCGARDKPLWFSRAAWGLRALAEGYRQVLGGRAPRFWVPDFFCDQALWPLRQAGAELVFYPVDETLEPDWRSCERMAAASPPELFLQVHYFGFPATLARARAFCLSHDAALIEDAAHVLAPFGRVGEAGDYVLYSLYKHFAVPDGGLLVIRPSAGEAGQAIASAHAPVRTPSAMAWMAKRLLQVTLPKTAARLASAPLASFEADPATIPLADTPALGAIARRLLHPASTNIPGIAASRRLNERNLRDVLKGAPGLTPLMPPPGEDTAPFRAVFRADTPARAADWYRRFQQAGGVVETWPDLAPEVRAAPARHEVAIALRHSILALPVHAWLTPEQLSNTYGGAL